VQKGCLKTKGLYSSYVLLMYTMKQRTTIQIEYTTLEKLRTLKIAKRKLRTLKIAKRESYDEIINRLIKRGEPNE